MWRSDDIHTLSHGVYEVGGIHRLQRKRNGVAAARVVIVKLLDHFVIQACKVDEYKHVQLSARAREKIDILE